jgi:hypothetical protein
LEYVVARGGERAIGSTATSLGFHGHIALTLFVRASLQQNGSFEVPEVSKTAQEVTRGKNLGVVRAANKGAVGVPCRLGSSTLAFVTCHLASDSKGKSKIGSRNTDSREILRGLSLTVDEESYDLPHMQHHTVFMGDLNYRNTVRYTIHTVPQDTCHTLYALYTVLTIVLAMDPGTGCDGTTYAATGDEGDGAAAANGRTGGDDGGGEESEWRGRVGRVGYDTGRAREAAAATADGA